MTRSPVARPHPVAKRRSPLPALLLTGLVAAGAVAGATAVFSGRTQTLTQDFSRQITQTLNATGYLSAKETGYQKGFGSSTQTMTLTLKPEKTGLDKPVELLLTNHIQHGPFPGMQGVGQAIINTDIRFADPQLQAQYDKMFGGKKPTIRTLVGLGGDTSTDIVVPSGSLNEKGAVTNWQALTGNIKVNGGQVVSDMQWPGLTMTSDKAKAQIAGVSFQAESQQQTGGQPGSAQALAGTGSSVFKVASLNFSDQDGDVKMGNLELSGATRQSAPGFYDTEAKYLVGQMESKAVGFKNLQFQVGLRHLAQEPLNNILKFIDQLQKSMQQADKTGGDVPEPTEAQTRQLEKDVQALLKGNPRLTLDRLSVTQPSGDIVLTGQASAPKLAEMSAEEMQMLTKAPTMLAGMLELHLEAQGKEQAVRELLSLVEDTGNKAGSSAPDLNGSVQAMVDQGYLTRQGDQLKATFDLKEGQPVLNGQPLQ